MFHVKHRRSPQWSRDADRARYAMRQPLSCHRPFGGRAWDTSRTTRQCRPLVAARAQVRARPSRLAEDRSPSHEPPPRRDRGDRHRARRSHASCRYITVGDAVPHPVLVGGVIWTIAAGIDRGIAWAFVGGLVLDSLLGRPLGTSALALLLAVGAAALIAQPFPRLRPRRTDRRRPDPQPRLFRAGPRR